jgi:hypothetical protein
MGLEIALVAWIDAYMASVIWFAFGMYGGGYDHV